MNLKEQIQNKIKELQDILKVIKIFPDIKTYVNRWGSEYFYDKSANSKVTHIDLHNGCGCCSDSPLLAKCYLIHDGIQIYADPIEINIGEKNGCGYGEIVYDDWQEILQKHNINRDVYPIVEKFIEDNPVSYFDDEEDEEW